MSFYDPNGEEINNVSDFISIYSKLYYINKENEVYKYKLPTSISKNNELVENRFDALLRADKSFSKDDYRDIMAWKIDVIDQKRSSNTKLVFNKSGWDDQDYSDPHATAETRYGKLEIGKLIKAMDEETFDNLACEDGAQAFLDYLRDYRLDSDTRKHKGILGLGTVYMMTLLYFETKGKWPIYDKYAAIALLAFEKGIKPDWHEKNKDGKIIYIAPPDKNDSHFKNVVNELLVPYKEAISRVFDYEKYENNRDIDRALWVYGHLFKLKHWMF